MNYFSGCTNMNQAKIRFRELAKKYHPDAGGDANIFSEISHQMDCFTPTSHEHSNFFGSSQKMPNEDLNHDFKRAYHNLKTDGSQYRFNTTNQQSFGNSSYQHFFSIPFDHPIHEELTQERKLKELHQKNFDSMIFNYEEACKREANLLLKMEKMNAHMTKKDEEIVSLKSQIEVLSRPIRINRISILDKIRRYFEK